MNILKKVLAAIGKYSLIPLCICLFGIFIYPTMYKYDKLNQKIPVKINRITGETEILHLDGYWIKAGDSENELRKFEEYKQQIYETMENQNETIKQEVLAAIREELELIKEKQASIDTRPGNKIAEPEVQQVNVDNLRGNVNTFSIGDSKEIVELVMGVPDTIGGDSSFEYWMYGYSTVNFTDGKVSGWDNADNNLKIGSNIED